MIALRRMLCRSLPLGLGAATLLMTVACAHAALSEKIVFCYRSAVMSHYDVYIQGLDGSGLTDLTNTADLDEYEATVSPDGKHIAYVQLRHADTAQDGIYVMSIDGSSPQQVVSRMDYAGERAYCPVWLDPDTLAFSAWPVAASSASSVYEVDLGGAAQALFALSDALGQPGGQACDVSPDGTRFVLCANDAAWAPTCDVYAADLNGANGSLVYGDSPDDWRDPIARWSPVGDLIAFSHWTTQGANQSPEHMAVATIAPSGSGFKLITGGGGFWHVQDFRPDGSRLLVFCSDFYGDPGNHVHNHGNLWTMKPNGGARIRVTDLPGWFPMQYELGGGVEPRAYASWVPILRPDGHIRKQGATGWAGLNVYNTTGAGQQRTILVTAGGKAVFHVRLQGDGNALEALRVAGAASTAKWTVSYFDAQTGGTEITGAVTGSGWLSPRLAPGATLTIRVEVAATASAVVGDRMEVPVALTSTADATQQDVVLAKTRLARKASAACLLSGLAAVPTVRGGQLVFSLSESAHVGVIVRNLAGRPVRSVCQDRACEAGAQVVLWDGLSDFGLPVPRGAYLVEVNARSADGAQTHGLARLSLTR